MPVFVCFFQTKAFLYSIFCKTNLRFFVREIVLVIYGIKLIEFLTDT
jgi:hypothetical protein